MRWRADRDALRAAVDTARRAVGSTHLPVLHGLRMDAHEDGSLDVCGTDLSLTITATAKGATESAGAVIVPSTVLAGWLAKAPDGAVTIDAENDRATVTAGSASIVLPTLRLDEWPRLPGPEGQPVVLDESAWADVRSILPFASTDRDRPIVCAVNFDEDGAWSTDSYRLGWAKFQSEVRGMIPAAALKLIAREITDGGLSLSIDDRHAHIERDGTRWTITLTMGEWPKAKGLIPPARPLAIEVDRSELVDALNRAAVVSAVKGWPVVLTGSDDLLEVTATDVDHGTSVDHVDAAVTGEIRSGFLPSHLLQAVESMGADRLTLQGVDGNKPWVIENGDLLHLLMPRRIPS